MLHKAKKDSEKAESDVVSESASILRKTCRRAIVETLHNCRLLDIARNVARRYSISARHGSGFPRFVRHPLPKFGILCYHRVGVEGVPLHSRLEPKRFDAQMRHLKKHYRIVPLGQLCHELREASPVAPTLAITFDDGYRDLYRHAFPVLQKYSIPATIYLIGRCMETGEVPWYDRIFLALQSIGDSCLELELDSPRSFALASAQARAAAAWEIICFLRSIPDAQRRTWCTEMQRRYPVDERKLTDRMLDWAHVREMRRGGVNFGAHSMTHPAVSRLEAVDFPEELAASKRLLEDGVDGPIEDFAYPFGKPTDFSRPAQAFLAECGYRSGVTTLHGYNSPGANPFELRRLQVDDNLPFADFCLDICRMFLNGPEESGPANVALPGRREPLLAVQSNEVAANVNHA